MPFNEIIIAIVIIIIIINFNVRHHSQTVEQGASKGDNHYFHIVTELFFWTFVKHFETWYGGLF